VQLLIATQVADEHRHLQSVLRIYEEVFGVKGGFEAIRQMADENRDVIADTLYEALGDRIGNLAASGTEEDYVKAVVSYHILGEGVAARTAQNLAAGQYERYGDFPGLTEGQRHVARDEARHIGIGVTYLRQMLAHHPGARDWVDSILDDFAVFAADLLETALAGDMHDQVVAGYGVEPAGFYEEAIRQLQIRMRSVGYLED
jgi:ribonucleotide reductase beta subunit family protein with ferritin-like domain